MRKRDLYLKSLVVLIALFTTPVAVVAVQQGQADEVITLHYVDRPPYTLSQPNDIPTGVVANPVMFAFKKAGIPYVWEKTPWNRQLAIIRENKGLDCVIGLEKTSLRTAYGKFTEPVYISQPFVAITSLQVKEKSGVTLSHMLSKYTILAKENYTQGNRVTALIMNSPNKYVTSAQSSQMVQMIAQGRADFMMISNDEIEYYVQHGVLNPKDIHVITLSDVHIRFARRIMCSKRVDDSVMEKLNHVIASMKVKPAPFKDVKKEAIKRE